MNEDIKPFIILGPDGKTAALLQTNTKGFKKSIENSCIWAVNPDTGRLLPEEDLGKAGSFRENPDWFEAVVVSAPEPADADGIDHSGTAAPMVKDAKRVDSSIIERLFTLIESRRIERPEGSYTTHLFNSGLSKIKKKTGEEAVELLLAETREEQIYEAADLIYHMLVLFAETGIKPEEIFKELESRE